MRTRFTNESGAERYFGYLPPHGITLGDGESVVFDGDLHTILALKRGVSRKIDNESMDRDLHLGLCNVEQVADQSSSSSV